MMNVIIKKALLIGEGMLVGLVAGLVADLIDSVIVPMFQQ